MGTRVKILLVPVIILIAVLFTGCFDYEETMVFNEDGSGTITMKYSVEKAYIEQMQQMYKQMAEGMPGVEIPEDPFSEMFDKENIEASLAENNNEVTLVDYVVTETENARVWDMKFAFQDINNLDKLYEAVSPEDEYTYVEESEEPAEELFALVTKQDDGSYLYLRPMDDMEMEEDQESEEDYYPEAESEEDYSGSESEEEYAEQLDAGIEQLTESVNSMAESMGNHTMVFKVTFPGKVVESNATKIDGNTATWIYKFNEMEGKLSDQRAVYKQ